MITLGFAGGYSDLATLDVAFPHPSAYLYVSAASGNIVFQNTLRQAQYFPAAQAGGLYPLAATMVLTSGTVNGTLRTTTPDMGIVYISTGKGV